MSQAPPPLEAYWQQQILAAIPLARHLGLQVDSISPEWLKLRAPLGGNTNLQGTAFAGSLYAVAVLSGWAWLSYRLSREPLATEVVIQQATTRYLRPVSGEFVATVAAPEAAQLERFLRTLRRARRARIALAVQLTQDGITAMTLQGSYVALHLP